MVPRSRERLTAKPESAHAREIIELADLRGRVPLQCQQRVITRHPAAIVTNFDPLFSAVLQEHFHRARPGVNGVFDQLLDHRCGALDDLSGGNLVHQLGGENVDAGHL